MPKLVLSRITLIFSALYLLFTLGDTWSTHMALNLGQGQEFNPAMGDGEGGLVSLKFWVINIIMLAVTIFMLEWALRHKQMIDNKYLRNPLLAAFNWIYVNPFSKRNAPKAAFHWLAIALSFLFIKPFAILNNLNIAAGGSGFLDGAVLWLGQYFSGTLLYIVAVSLIVLPIWIGALFIIARILKSTPRNTNQSVMA